MIVPVYDILNCGPRHRFVANGKLVHNSQGINLQNLPRGGELRAAITAPEGHSLIPCDLSQIEARMLAWVAGQEDLVRAFADKRDVYSEFATDIYGVPVTKADKEKRFTGKTCLSSGTQVLTRRGWVRIVEVTDNDQLWDGEEWVTHQGVSFMGVKPTISLSGVEMTPDHEILTAHSKWEPAQTLLENKAAFQSALALASLPSLAMSNTLLNAVCGVGDLCAAVDYAGQNIPITEAISGKGVRKPVMFAQKEKPPTSVGGGTKMPCPTTCRELAYSIGWLRRSPDATPPQVNTILTTECGGLLSHKSGEMTVRSSCAMFRPYPVGTTLQEIWTDSTTTKGMNPATYALQQGPRTRPINDGSLIWKPVFDILNSGSRHRFTILTAEGPLIVHNCILGLGYMTGAEKLRHTLAIGQGGVKVNIPIEEAKRIVQLYRSKNHRIVAFWRICDHAIQCLYNKTEFDILPGVLKVDAQGVRLPNGMYLTYPGLRPSESGRGWEYISDMRMHRRNPENGWTKLYGGKLCENIIQALARIVIVEYMYKVSKHYRVVMQVHDEIIPCVPDELVETARAFIERVMRTPPKWAPGLPVDCESGVGKNYRDAK